MNTTIDTISAIDNIDSLKKFMTMHNYKIDDDDGNDKYERTNNDDDDDLRKERKSVDSGISSETFDPFLLKYSSINQQTIKWDEHQIPIIAPNIATETAAEIIETFCQTSSSASANRQQWSLSMLQQEFKLKNTEQYFKRYQQRLSHRLFTVLLILNITIGLIDILAAIISFYIVSLLFFFSFVYYRLRIS